MSVFLTNDHITPKKKLGVQIGNEDKVIERMQQALPRSKLCVTKHKEPCHEF
jgi:hypothetical protein